MVDQFAKTDLSRFNYIECHQKELRAEIYSGAKDAMKSDGLGKVGKGRSPVIFYWWRQVHASTVSRLDSTVPAFWASSLFQYSDNTSKLDRDTREFGKR